MNAIKKIGLVPRLIIALILGALVGSFMPSSIIRIFTTLSGLFSSFLSFIIPLMIIGFVVIGIAELSSGAGKLLGLTTVVAYGSTIIAGCIALLVATFVFPTFITSNVQESILAASEASSGIDLSPYFSIPLKPMLDVTSAIVFAFVMGLSISYLRGKGKGETSYNLFQEFSIIITNVLKTIIIPLLPLYILGTFANITASGQVVAVIKVFAPVFLIVILLHLAYLAVFYIVSGTIGGKNPFTMMKNQVPAYLTAVGTQSSAATIPVNIACAEKNGVSKDIREFVIPLCATIHLAGSIITVTSCVTAVLMMNNMDHSFATMLPFILMLGIAMVAAPGAPGGAIISALPFLGMVGIAPEGALASLLITLYITQDSFGTAANVSGDSAIAVIIDTFYNKFIKKTA